jgi:hypothetical protein
MALRIGLLKSSALQNDGLDVPVLLQCRTPRETNHKGPTGPNYFLIKSLFSPWWSCYVLGPSWVPHGPYGAKLLFDKIIVFSLVVLLCFGSLMGPS